MLYDTWLGHESGRLELSALVTDALALLELGPVSPQSLRRADHPELQTFVDLESSLKICLADHVVPSLRRVMSRANAVASPYAGGLTYEQMQRLTCADNAPSDLKLESIRVATFNPGRTGFLCLGSQRVLDWRLHAVAHASVELNIQLCFLPGARLPNGECTSNWASVGVFCANEFLHAVRVVDGLDSSRILGWKFGLMVCTLARLLRSSAVSMQLQEMIMKRGTRSFANTTVFVFVSLAQGFCCEVMAMFTCPIC